MIVKVRNLKEWEDVIRLALFSGNNWDNFDQAKDGEINSQLYLKVVNTPVYVKLDNGRIIYDVFSTPGAKVISAEEYLSSRNFVYKVTPQEFKLLNIIKEHDGQTLLRAISENWRWLQNLHAIGTKALLKWFADDPNVNIEVGQSKYILQTRNDAGSVVYYADNFGVPSYVYVKEVAKKFDTEEEAKAQEGDIWRVVIYDGEE